MIHYLKEVLGTLKIKYSFPKIQWLVGTSSAVSLLYLSSQELWSMFDSKPFPEITKEGIICYLIFFFSILLLIHYGDTRKVIQKRLVALGTSLISIVLDVCVISLFELVVLVSLQVLPQNSLDTIGTLLLGAMPASIGAVALSSLTADVLKKRAEKLREEVKIVSKQVEDLQSEVRSSEKRLKAFEKKKSEFEDIFRKKEIERDETNEK